MRLELGNLSLNMNMEESEQDEGGATHRTVPSDCVYTFPNLNAATVEIWKWIRNSSHTLLDMWLLIHAGIKVQPC